MHFDFELANFNMLIITVIRYRLFRNLLYEGKEYSHLWRHSFVFVVCMVTHTIVHHMVQNCLLVWISRKYHKTLACCLRLEVTFLAEQLRSFWKHKINRIGLRSMDIMNSRRRCILWRMEFKKLTTIIDMSGKWNCWTCTCCQGNVT